MASSLSRTFTRLGAFSRIVQRSQITRQYANEATEPVVAQAGQMLFTFASPSQAFYENTVDVKQVDVPTGTGSIGILASHVPTFGVLQPGVMTVYENEGSINKYFVSSGTYAVNEDASVQITAEEAVPIDQLDKEVARSNMNELQSELSSATTEKEKVEVQIAMECNEAIINAI